MAEPKKKIEDKKVPAKKTDKVVEAVSAEPKKETSAKLSKKRVEVGILYIQSTYNNTLCILTDAKGNALAQSSAGALGFKGAKKGTPFAAAKVGEVLADKGKLMGLREVAVVIKGVGSGRESAVRSFITKGISISSVKDVTPVPHNGPRPPRARRV